MIRPESGDGYRLSLQSRIEKEKRKKKKGRKEKGEEMRRRKKKKKRRVHAEPLRPLSAARQEPLLPLIPTFKKRWGKRGREKKKGERDSWL